MLLPPAEALPVAPVRAAARNPGRDLHEDQCSPFPGIQWKLHRAKSCVWTSGHGQGVVSRMDDDTRDLIVQLCTRVGTIMEDISAVALTISGMAANDRLAALEEIRKAAERISTLVEAVRLIMD